MPPPAPPEPGPAPGGAFAPSAASPAGPAGPLGASGPAAAPSADGGAAQPPRGRVAELAEWWAAVFRSAPIGVLVLGVLLLFVGAGFVLGGLFLALGGAEASWLGWGLAGAAGPLFLYVALNLLMLRRWAWLVLVILLTLMLVSSLLRTATAIEIPVAPLAEVAIEVLSLGYLLRPRVRGAFSA